MGVVVAMMQNQCASNGFISAQNHCCINNPTHTQEGGSIAKWLACWTQAQKGLGSNHSRDTVG